MYLFKTFQHEYYNLCVEIYKYYNKCQDDTYICKHWEYFIFGKDSKIRKPFRDHIK